MTAETLAVDDLLPVFERHASMPEVSVRVPQVVPKRCLICGEPGQAPECNRHVIDHDVYLDRCTDV